MSVATLQKVLRDARRLPLHGQTELAEILLREVSGFSQKKEKPKQRPCTFRNYVWYEC